MKKHTPFTLKPLGYTPEDKEEQSRRDKAMIDDGKNKQEKALSDFKKATDINSPILKRKFNV